MNARIPTWTALTHLHAKSVLEQNRALCQPLSDETQVESGDDVLCHCVVLLRNVPRLAAGANQAVNGMIV